MLFYSDFNMYNSLVLIALLPIAGPDAGRHVVDIPRAATIQYARSTDDAGDRIPTIVEEPIRREVAYMADDEPAPLFSPIPVAPRPETAPEKPTETSATFAAADNRQALAPNVVRTKGILEIPKWNNVNVTAPHQAVLMTLQTEQRDARGNVVKDASGNPVYLPIREGMRVFKGQVLGNFDDRELQKKLRVAQAEHNVALTAKNKLIEVEFAATSVQSAIASLNILKSSNRMHEGSISKLEIIKSELEVAQAQANLDLQKYVLEHERTAEVEVAQARVEEIEVLIGLRKIVASISGTIVKVDKAEGEWLREGDTVLEIVQLDTLRAKCKVNAKYYTQQMIDGKDVSVFMPMVNGRTETFPGKVVFVDQKISAGDEFEIFIEVQNQPDGQSWLLQPGRTITAEIRI